MSKKSKALLDEFESAVENVEFNARCGYNGPQDYKRATDSRVAVEDYIAGLHQRIAELHRGNARLTQWNHNQAKTIRLWRSRAVALGHTTPVVDDRSGEHVDPVTYQGHAGTTGGLQAHSVGELYPYIIVKQGERWHVDHAVRGRVTGVGYEYQHQAVTTAQAFKLLDEDKPNA